MTHSKTATSLFLFLLFFCVTIGTAQKSKPANDLEDKSYKGNIKIVSEQIYHINSPEGTTTFISKTDFMFNLKGNFSEILGYKEDNTLDKKIVYQYDNNNNLFREDYYTLTENQTLALEYSYTYIYNSKNQLMEENHFVVDDEGKLNLDEIYNYTYNDKGLLFELQQIDDHKEHIKRGRFIYDSTGNNVLIIRFNSEDISFQEEKSTYDKHGNKLTTFVYDKAGKITAQYLFRYDPQNQLVEELNINMEGKVINKNTYTYNENGLISKSVSLVVDKNINTQKAFFYKLDNSKNWIEKVEIKMAKTQTRTTTTKRDIKYY